MNRRFEITDDEWTRLAPLLPAMTPQRGGRWWDHRQISTAACSGCAAGCLAGPARPIPTLGDGRQAVRALADRRDLGTYRGGVADPGRCGRGAGLGCPGRRDGGPGHQHAAGPAKGAHLDPGKPAAGAGAVTGGLTTKLHTIGDSRDLATRLTPGQDADTTQLVGLVDAVRVARPGGRGRPRPRVAQLTGDKAYSTARTGRRCAPGGSRT